MSLTIRAARPADAPEMTAILNEIIAIGGTTAFEDPQSVEDVAAEFITRATLICSHVALDAKGRVAGFQYLNRNAAYGPDIGDIATFARQSPKTPGVGTALFQATRAAARSAGLNALNAKIRADNVSGLAYYSKMGFTDHDVDPAVPLKDGTPVDRILKRHPL